MTKILESKLEDVIKTRVEEQIEFTLKIARDFYRKRLLSGIEQGDFESAALLGLCDASRRFDDTKGMNFRTFAYFRIKGAMLDLLRRSGRIPRPALRRIIEHQKAHETAAIEDVEDEPPIFPLPYAANLAEFTDLTQIASLLGVGIVPACSDGMEELVYLHTRSPETIAIGTNLRRFLGRFIEKLPPDQQRVIEMRYFDDRNLEEIRNSFCGVSKSWLSRLHGQALGNLRRMLDDANRSAAIKLKTAEYRTEITEGGGRMG